MNIRSISAPLATSSKRDIASGWKISSSNFPRFDRNPNTGHDLFADAETRPALQTVMHRTGYASHLTLPIVPART